MSRTPTELAAAINEYVTGAYSEGYDAVEELIKIAPALESYAALGRKVAALQCEDNLEFLPCGVVWLRGKYYPNIWAAFGLPKPPDDAGQEG